MADVKREQELAERRKNEPRQQDLAQDHLVRKIFSRFRKPSDAGTLSSRPTSSQAATQKVGPFKIPVTAVDTEAGVKPASLGDAFAKLKAPSSEVDSAPDSRSSTAKSGPKMSRWAALTGGSKEETPATGPTTVTSVVAIKGDEEKDEKEVTSRRTELVCRKSDHIHVVKDIRPPTQGNQWPKVIQPVRPDTIDESGEGDASTGGLVVGDSAGGLATRQRTSSLAATKGVTAVELQQLFSTLLEIKVDIKTEIANINTRINQIDQHVEDVTKKMIAAQEEFYSELKNREALSVEEAVSKQKKREGRSLEKSPRSKATSYKTKLARTSLPASRSVPTATTTTESSESKPDQQQPKQQQEEDSVAGGAGTLTDEDQDLTSKL